MSLRKVTLSGLLAPSSSPSCITKRQKGERERERRRKLLQERSFTLRGRLERRKYSMSGIGGDNGVGVRVERIEMFQTKINFHTFETFPAFWSFYYVTRWIYTMIEEIISKEKQLVSISNRKSEYWQYGSRCRKTNLFDDEFKKRFEWKSGVIKTQKWNYTRSRGFINPKGRRGRRIKERQ